MAAVNDCFTIGSIVLCTTCFNQEVKGEVLAFDHNTKMLILKCRSNNTELNDVYALNLSFCSNVQVIKEVHTAVEGPQKLNIEQLKIRLRNTVDQRQRWVKSINADASPEAQELYRMIAKQFKSQEVTWNGQNIKIFDEVTIQPPYGVMHVVGNPRNPGLCNYIKKMVHQFYKTQAGQTKGNAGQGTSSSSSSSASSSSAPSQSAGTSSNNVSSTSPVPAN